MDTIHKRIKARREKLKMSKRAFGEALGVNYQTVQQWETDPDPTKPETKSTAPKRTRIAEVARILRVSESWLVTGKEDDGSETDPLLAQLISITRLLPPEGQDLLLQQANGLYTALNPSKRSPANPFGGKKPPKKKP